MGMLLLLLRSVFMHYVAHVKISAEDARSAERSTLGHINVFSGKDAGSDLIVASCNCDQTPDSDEMDFLSTDILQQTYRDSRYIVMDVTNTCLLMMGSINTLLRSLNSVTNRSLKTEAPRVLLHVHV